MKIHRFSLDHLPSGGQVVITDPQLIHHLRDVLELRKGETVQVFDTEVEWSATIDKIEQAQITLHLGAIVAPLVPLAHDLKLAVSLLKGDAWDDMVREVSQLGVTSIQPLLCEHTIVRQLTKRKLERYQIIAREATELSGGRRIPEILPPQEFSLWLMQAPLTSTVVLDQSGRQLISLELPQSVTLAIGPEGGWTKAELAQVSDQGIATASLLPRVLTARFAPEAAAAAIQVSSLSNRRKN